MPAVTSIVLADGKATPLNHTFAPTVTEASRILYEDRAAGVMIGYNKLTLTVRRPSGDKSGPTRNMIAGVKIETPILETIGNSASGYLAAPSVAYRPVMELTATLPERCTLQDRKDLWAYMKSLINTAEATNPLFQLVVNGEQPY